MQNHDHLECTWETLDALSNNRKLIEGEGGWLFLTNDTNNQLAQQFGLKQWDDAACSSAISVIGERVKHLPGYKKFIVPEKSVIYHEYLPDPIRSWNDSDYRPACRLTNASYLLPQLSAAKHIGGLYFRGDTHPNWMGSYFIYRAIAEQLAIEPLQLHEFIPHMAGYDGDLFGYLSESEKQEFLMRVDHFPSTLDVTPLLTLAEPKARHCGMDGYNQFSRETWVYENPDKSLPKAVVFRDSTCQFIVPWLAEHFSRSVFVWHRGDVLAEVIEREQPDIIFQVMAERFIWTYPDRVALS